MPIATALILAGLLSGKDALALEPDWKAVATASTGAVYYMHKHFGEPKAEVHPKAWIIGDYRRDATEKYRSDKTFIEFQCDRNTYQILESIRYSANGAVQSVEGAVPSANVPPKTVAEEWYWEACMPYVIDQASDFTR